MTHSQVHTVLGAQGSMGRAIIHELAQQGLPVRAVDRAANPARLPPGHRAPCRRPHRRRRCAPGGAGSGGGVLRRPARLHPLARAVFAADGRPDRGPERQRGQAGDGGQPLYVRAARRAHHRNPAAGGHRPQGSGPHRDRPAAARRPPGGALPGDVRAAHRLLRAVRPRPANSVPCCFQAALEGQPTTWIGHPDVLRSYSYLPDVARAFAVLGQRGEADGQAWHLPTAGPMTGQDFLELVYREAGRPLPDAGGRPRRHGRSGAARAP